MELRKPLAALCCGLAFVMSAAQAQKQVQSIQPAGVQAIKPIAPVAKLPVIESPKTLTKPTLTDSPKAIGKPGLDPSLKNLKTGNAPLTVTAPTSPLDDKKFGTGTGSSLDQFKRDAQLTKITGRGADLINEARNKDAPGGSVNQPTDKNITHDFDSGRGTAVSKRAQQSDGGPIPIPYPTGGGGADKPSGGITPSQGDNAGVAAGVVSSKPGPEVPIKVDSIGPIIGEGAISRPAPDSDGGDGGGPVFGKKEKPSIADIEKTRKRQVGMPSEGSQALDKIKVDQKTAAAVTSGRRANAINPADENSGQSGVSPGSTNPTGPAGRPNAGNKPVPGQPQHGGNCPDNSPTC